jgi:hypothetical protein
MRRKITTIAGLALLAAGALAVARARPAAAQELEPPRSRQGYYVSLGLYGMVSQVSEKGDSLGPWTGFGGAFRFGQLVTRRFGLGLSIEEGRTKGDGQTAGIGALGLEANWELLQNLAVRGGVGLGFVNLHNPADVNESATRGVTGSWYSLGVAYDWFPSKKRLSGGFSVTPTVQARYVPGGDTSGFVAYFGVELGWWTGLARNQLELPESEAYKKRK